MSTELRDLLARVAAGEVTPAEAAHLLDESESVAAPITDTATAPQPAATSLTSLAIRTDGAEVTVVADPSVAEAVAEGPHTFVREGNTLRLTTGRSEDPHGFWVDSSMPRWLAWLPQAVQEKIRVVVRVNPNLPVTIDGMASAVAVTGSRSPLVVRLKASQLTVSDHESTVDLKMSMGQIDADLLLTEGDSTIISDVGAAHVWLRRGSDLRLTCSADMGSVDIAGLPRANTPLHRGMQMRDEVVLGDGRGSLVVSARMGEVAVQVL